MPRGASATSMPQAFHGSNNQASHRSLLRHGPGRARMCDKANVPECGFAAVNREKAMAGVGGADGTNGGKARLSRARDDGVSDDAAPPERRPRRHGLEPVARQGRRTGRGRRQTRRPSARGGRLPPASSSCASPMPPPSKKWCSVPTAWPPDRRPRKARRRLLLDSPRCGARHRGAAEDGERHGMDRCAGFRRHHGRRGRHARGDGRRRCRRYRAGAALCPGDGAAAHPYGADRRGPDRPNSATR